MNPFVNPNKRSISLPDGCKDLVDVLNRPEFKPDDAFRRFIYLILFQAQQDGATELIIGVAPPSGGTPIKYKIRDDWHDMQPFPSHIRPAVVSELARMAKLATGQFPSTGVLDITCGTSRLLWSVRMTSADGECILTRGQV
jgi:hypothetical protein